MKDIREYVYFHEVLLTTLQKDPHNLTHVRQKIKNFEKYITADLFRAAAIEVENIYSQGNERAQNLLNYHMNELKKIDKGLWAIYYGFKSDSNKPTELHDKVEALGSIGYFIERFNRIADKTLPKKDLRTIYHIGRFFSIDNPVTVCDIETKTEIPHHSDQTTTEIYLGNFKELKERFFDYRMDEIIKNLPKEHILPIEYRIKSELQRVKQYIKLVESDPTAANNRLKYGTRKNYPALLEMYRDYLLERLKNPQLEKSKESALKKNPDSNIFTNDFAFTLFTLMHEQRPKRDNPKAFYSATYILMKKDGHINGSIQPSVFKNYVERYSNGEVYLEKIDKTHNPSQKNKLTYSEQKQSLLKQG